MISFDCGRCAKMSDDELRIMVFDDYKTYTEEAIRAAIVELHNRGEDINAEKLFWYRQRKSRKFQDDLNFKYKFKPLETRLKVYFFIVPVAGFFYWAFGFRKWQTKRKQAILISGAGLIIQFFCFYLFSIL